MNTETLLDAIGSVNDCFITALSDTRTQNRLYPTGYISLLTIRGRITLSSELQSFA